MIPTRPEATARSAPELAPDPRPERVDPLGELARPLRAARLFAGLVDRPDVGPPELVDEVLRLLRHGDDEVVDHGHVIVRLVLPDLVEDRDQRWPTRVG